MVQRTVEKVLLRAILISSTMKMQENAESMEEKKQTAYAHHAHDGSSVERKLEGLGMAG